MKTQKRLSMWVVLALLSIGSTSLLFVSSNKVSAATPGWYDPAPWGSNVECRKGSAYGPDTLNNGQCRVNWNGVVSGTINNMINSIAGGLTGANNGWPPH